MITLEYLNKTGDGPKTFDDFISMYKNYCDELHRFNKNVPLLSTDEIVFDVLADSDNFKTHPINPEYRTIYMINNGDETVGFMMVGFGSNKPEGADAYIEEFYIKPKYRTKGYGARAVMSLVRPERGTSEPIKSLFLNIIKENKGARSFWIRTLTDLNFKRVLIDKQEEEDWLDDYMFVRAS